MANRTSRIEVLLSIRTMSVRRVIVLLRAQNLLRTAMSCPHCGTAMAERERAGHIDGIAWICYNNACPKKRSSVSIRKDSFFASFRISLADVWTLVLMWSESVQVCDAANRYGIDKRCVKAVYSKLVDIISMDLSADPVKLGGVGIICQIDESLFCHKQKYGRGRAPERETWVFGIADTSTTPAHFHMEVVPDRTAATLLPIIRRVCRPGTIIHSDMWASYQQIDRTLRFEHGTVNHSLHFVNPETGVHTQNIESCWGQRKAKIRAMKGIRSEHLPALLREFVWKDKVRGCILRHLVFFLKIQ